MIVTPFVGVAAAAVAVLASDSLPNKVTVYCGAIVALSAAAVVVWKVAKGAGRGLHAITTIRDAVLGTEDEPGLMQRTKDAAEAAREAREVALATQGMAVHNGAVSEGIARRQDEWMAESGRRFEKVEGAIDLLQDEERKLVKEALEATRDRRSPSPRSRPSG